LSLGNPPPDEINRNPPKILSALLEAMQEKQLTVAAPIRREEPTLPPGGLLFILACLLTGGAVPLSVWGGSLPLLPFNFCGALLGLTGRRTLLRLLHPLHPGRPPLTGLILRICLPDRKPPPDKPAVRS